MTVEIVLETLVALLLLVTVIYCFVLNRRLSTLRDSQNEMIKLLDDFSSAMKAAEKGVADFRQASREIGSQLQERVEAARALSDELHVIIESGDDLANRLEKGLVGRRREGNKIKSDIDDSDAGRSESERELLKALRRGK